MYFLASTGERLQMTPHRLVQVVVHSLSVRPSAHDHRFQPEQSAEFLQRAGLMSHAQSIVMSRALFAPAIHEFIRRKGEAEATVGVPDA